MSDNTLLVLAAIGAGAWILHRKGSTEPHPLAVPAIATSQGSVGVSAAHIQSATLDISPVSNTPIVSTAQVIPLFTGSAASDAGVSDPVPVLAPYQAPAIYQAPPPPPQPVAVGPAVTTASSAWPPDAINAIVADTNALGVYLPVNAVIDQNTGFINGMNPWQYCMMLIISKDQSRYAIPASQSAISNQAAQLWVLYGQNGDSVIDAWSKAYTVPMY